MEDAAIVALLREGESAGLAEAYTRYADRLFAYSMSLLGDHDAAADAVHDTFIIAAERIGQLRDPDRLRPWLYAIARNECLRIIQARRRSAVLDEDALEGVGAMTDQTADPGVELRQEELRQLVWSAADGLNPREREILELSVRHGLDGAELASTIGVSPNHVHALLSKSRQQLERALGALIVARTGRRDCATLDSLLTGWGGQMSVLLRKRIARHIDTCEVCAERKQRDVSATALLGATPLLLAPAALRERVLDRIGDIQLVAQHAAIAARAGRFGRDGFPFPLDRRRRTLGWQAPTAAAVAAVALILSGLVLEDNVRDAGLGATTPPTDLILPGTPLRTRSPDPAPSTTSQPSTSPSPRPSPSSLPSSTSAPPPGTTTPPGATTSRSETTPPTTPETTESTPPTADLLRIYCFDDLTAECRQLQLTEPSGWIRLATGSSAPVTVAVHVPKDASWLLLATQEPITVSPNETVPVYFRLDSPPRCQWRVAVSFEVVDFDVVETLAVEGGAACIG